VSSAVQKATASLLEKVEVEVVKKSPAKLPTLATGKTPSESRLAAFEDIRIVDFDDSKTERPDPKKQLFNVYLTLSADPADEWIKIFEAERQFPRHTMWRRAWIDGRSIVVYCALEEVKTHHLEDLKVDVKNSNAKFRNYLIETAQREHRQSAKENQERKAIDDLKDGLNFD
jgi:hypothetical protein